MKLVRHYTLEDASPLNGALSSPVPMLFIHGGDDTYVPARMSVLMAEKRREAGIGPSALALIPGAGHAKSIVVDRETWFREAFDFIDRVCTNKVE
jgi:dipeptidyl aminopeptidase/acylaminoacyl peptidase